MAFKKVDGGVKIPRFKEFDEARVYIENLRNYDKDIVFSAIDYMIIHKEYYFLLKNILSQFFEKGGEEFIDYTFSRMDCIKREEDKELLKKMLCSCNYYLSFKAFIYIIDCCETFKFNYFFKDLKITKKHIELFLERGDCEEVRMFLKKFKEEILETSRSLLDFFKIYDEEDFKSFKNSYRTLEEKE